MRVRKCVLGVTGLAVCVGLGSACAADDGRAPVPGISPGLAAAPSAWSSEHDPSAWIGVFPAAARSDVRRSRDMSIPGSEDGGRAAAMAFAEQLTTYEATAGLPNRSAGQVLSAYRGEEPNAWVVVVDQRLYGPSGHRAVTVSVLVVVERTEHGWRTGEGTGGPR